jgi:hypothetical protein
MKNSQLKAQLYLSCVAILLVGLCSSVLIYFTAEERAAAGMNYIIVNGEAYPVAPQSTKRYIRELERIGGKQAVIFDEIIRWFDERFSGKALGVTLGWISVAAALALFLFARWLPPDDRS